ncbi:MAG: protein-disulfide reductase DsbD [Idiomarina sp.]|uniref:Thiol:disulfide interchange protein DsbD n=2 Tax=Pseudidiomarina marina TaxID=502366 RepID=A0A432YEM5_9GAMM|nr:MAG: protein-disulfide reductase DsbD [Idiomarina sp.]RUO59389.1 protein-disulfide reductase DsbD [Pseudidiomarina marina]
MWYRSIVMMFALWMSLTSAVLAQAQFELGQDDPFAQQNQFLPVDEAFQFDFRQQGDKLTLSWEIADSYYMYQHRFVVKTPVQLKAEPQLPEGEPHVDEFFGETIVYRDFVELTYELSQASPDQAFTISYQGCADAGLCYPPTEKTVYLSAVKGDGSASIDFQQVAENSQQTTSSTFFDAIIEKPLWLVLLLFVVLGIGLAFTPCVLPMYPIISAIIMGQTGAGTSQPKQLSTRRAFTLSLAYVQGMAITYSILGVVVALAGLRYQAMLQHPAILITLAVVFVLLALSMLGAYTLQLPQSWQNYLNQLSQSQRGGAHRSVFTMGAISGLIASPCTTAPLSGVLLFIAQSGDLTIGAAVLYALSVGMGLPLLAFGVTGGKLLPKAGAWMNTIKRVFGVVLLGVAIVLVERLIPYVIADWLWVVFIVLSAIYLIQADMRELSKKAAARFAAAWLIISAVLLYSWWPQSHHSLPFIQVKSVAEIQRQLEDAAIDNKVVMLDLYADWCVACKEFERDTFSADEVAAVTADVVLLQADVTANTSTNNAILAEYQVLGLPTILFFRNQQEISRTRVTGFMPAENFAEHIKELKTR